ncbi:MAG TPA: hypothetical protein VFA07_14290 [Chthonomonadaceae bacterium]|nr:hypothetical protein [Chthonomonadaceae bacterium]
MKVTGLNPLKLIGAVALCLLAIALAIYVGKRSFEPVQIPMHNDFRKFGPGGPPNSRTMPPGSTPGSAR